MDDVQKLSVMIEHWLEHNKTHLGEYRKWSQRAAELGLEQVKTEIENAIEMISRSDSYLEKALTAVNFQTRRSSK
jgi:hypothetical protein